MSMIKLSVVLALSCSGLSPQDVPPSGVDSQQPGMNDLEREFAETMSGCRMVGRFTMRGSDRKAQNESYEIAKVTKVGGSKWRFHAKIQYAEKRAVTVPLTVDVKWAGDTPVIQVTDMKIPLMGTYTARVVVYRGEYAGTWSGVGYGGQMFGKIVPADPVATADAAASAGEGNWPDWRGPDGNRVAATGKPPTEWDEDDKKNVRYKVRVPGAGSSSPIVWGDRVYVTSAVEKGGGGEGQRGRPSTPYAFLALAYDRKTGKEVWRTTVREEVPHERWHETGSAASNSPVTDGERIYAFFGSRGLHCLDVKGNKVWSKDLGKMRIRSSFGEGASPALYGDKVIVNWDHEGESFILALDKKTGDEAWRQARREGTSWSTPLIVVVGGKPQVIVSATGASRGYDFASGEEIWSLRGMTANAIPSPVCVDGVAFLMSGFRGASLQAVKLAGAKGDLGGSANVLWQHGEETSYVPSHVVYGGNVYFLRASSGVLSCLDAKTGEVRYSGKKLQRIGVTYSSPIAAGGHVYITSRRGYTKVIKASAEFEEVATNRLKDIIDGTPAVAGDELFFRGQEYLYCVAADK